MPIYTGNKKAKLYIGNKKVRKAYLGNRLVYSAGSTVTYKVDSGLTYTEEADEGASVLSPASFTPAKSGWKFIGWREDASANGTVLQSRVMDDSPLTLYAVFRQAVTVTYYNGTTAANTASEYRYYNNGSVVNASFALTQAALSGWTARGWSTSTTANGGIAHANGAAFTRDSNITLYGMYQKTITLTTTANGSTAQKSETAYYNSINAGMYPAFTVSAPEKSGWTFQGWSSDGSTTVADSTISNLTLSASTARYAVWSRYVPSYQQDTGFTYTNGLCKNLSYNPGGAWTATGKVVGRMYSIANNTSGVVDVVVYIGSNAVRRWYNTPGWPDNMSSGEVKESDGYPGTGGKTFTVSGSGTLTGAVPSTSFDFKSLDATGTQWGNKDVYIDITKVTIAVPARTDYSVG